MAERAVTEMQVFVTKDGKQHKTFEEAMEHHQQHVCAEAIGAWVKEHMPGRDLEVQTQVTVCINQHWRELYGILAQRLDRASGVVPEEMFSVLDRTLPSLGLPERVLVALQDGGPRSVWRSAGGRRRRPTRTATDTRTSWLEGGRAE